MQSKNKYRKDTEGTEDTYQETVYNFKLSDFEKSSLAASVNTLEHKMSSQG